MEYIIYRIVVGELQTNCYLLVDAETKRCLIIDPGGDFQKIRSFIRSRNLTPLFIINTHGHADHIAANSQFGLPVYIHEDDAGFLSDPHKNLSPSPFIVQGRPERLLKDGNIIKAGNLNLEVIHTPGHTPGSICLLCGETLFSGDTLFASGVGRTDIPYSSAEKLINSIKSKLFVLADNIKVYPGHGPATTIGQEKKRKEIV